MGELVDFLGGLTGAVKSAVGFEELLGEFLLFSSEVAEVAGVGCKLGVSIALGCRVEGEVARIERGIDRRGRSMIKCVSH